MVRRQSYAVLRARKTSAFVAQVFSQRHSVIAYIDPTGQFTGEQFFGLPVLAATPPGTELPGHVSDRHLFPEMNAYSIETGTQDALTRELHQHPAIQLHEMSRKAFTTGLFEGAEYIQKFIFLKYNSKIPYGAQIGKGARLGYGGIGVVIHSSSIIGTNCAIGQNITIGGRSGNSGPPVIGDNVFIAPGATLLAANIGNSVVIGANSVVLDDIPDRCVVASVPARIISRNIEKYSSYIRDK